MSLDNVIPPEIINDAFYSELKTAAQRSELKTFLEIGSSSGTGSTQALVDGLLEREIQDAQLFCMELSRVRFLNLVNSYEQYPFVFPYNLSSVQTKDFPSREEVTHFYNSTKTNLNRYNLELVLSWLEQDIDYIKTKKLDFCGIDFIKSCNSIDKFDFVLIDGSEFTGEAELQHVWGARVIALDDVNCHKCFAAYVRLLKHYAYRLVSQDLELRNGYALFERAF
jgi:hypothetical protein